jgi:hypothetical protein
MEVRRGLVYPCQTMLDDVEIDASSYAVVKVDMVHENSKDLKLEVPPNDTTLTMRDAVTRRVLAVIKCIYLTPTYLYFIQDLEDRCLLLTSSTSFVDLRLQEHRMIKKHHMDQNPYIS